MRNLVVFRVRATNKAMKAMYKHALHKSSSHYQFTFTHFILNPFSSNKSLRSSRRCFIPIPSHLITPCIPSTARCACLSRISYASCSTLFTYIFIFGYQGSNLVSSLCTSFPSCVSNSSITFSLFFDNRSFLPFRYTTLCLQEGFHSLLPIVLLLLSTHYPVHSARTLCLGYFLASY